MIEEKDKFSQSDLFTFRDNLENIRGKLNEIASEMSDSLFDTYSLKKGKTSVDKMYYAGGTLCIDLKTETLSGNAYNATVFMNIGDETITWVTDGITDGEQKRQLMSIQNLWFAFTIYGAIKGHHRQYYRECYQKSCIRHLYNFLMERRPIDEKGTLPDEAIMGIYDMAEKADFAEELLSKYGVR